ARGVSRLTPLAIAREASPGNPVSCQAPCARPAARVASLCGGPSGLRLLRILLFRLLRQGRQQDVRRVLGAVVHRLLRRHVLRLLLVVAAGVQVAREQRERRRRHLQTQPPARRDADAGLPQVELVLVDLARLQQLRAAHRPPEAGAQPGTAQREQLALLVRLHQPQEPVGVLRRRRSEQHGRDRPGERVRLLERFGQVHQDVPPLRRDLLVIGLRLLLRLLAGDRLLLLVRRLLVQARLRRRVARVVGVAVRRRVGGRRPARQLAVALPPAPPAPR